MTTPTPRGARPEPRTTPRRARPYGPAAGEPPLFADPRRWGSLVGLVGGMVFIGSYSPALGPAAAMVAWAAGAALVLSALWAHYLRPVPLGPLGRARRLALVTYCCCAFGQVAVIALGIRALAAAGHEELRPALIAAVVGLHFLPMAWAFRERMFFRLGGAVTVLGAVGLLAGGLGVPRAADALAVAAGLVMLSIVLTYVRGRFAPRLPAPPVD